MENQTFPGMTFDECCIIQKCCAENYHVIKNERRFISAQELVKRVSRLLAVASLNAKSNKRQKKCL